MATLTARASGCCEGRSYRMIRISTRALSRRPRSVALLTRGRCAPKTTCTSPASAAIAKSDTLTTKYATTSYAGASTVAYTYS